MRRYLKGYKTLIIRTKQWWICYMTIFKLEKYYANNKSSIYGILGINQTHFRQKKEYNYSSWIDGLL